MYSIMAGVFNKKNAFYIYVVVNRGLVHTRPLSNITTTPDTFSLLFL